MPVLPLMPGQNSAMQSPMASTPPMPPPGMALGGPTGPGPGGDLASLMGVGGMPPTGGPVDPLQMGLGQFDQLAQLVNDLARMFPGSEQLASQMMEVIDQWRQQVLVMLTPQPSSMPGADQMM